MCTLLRVIFFPSTWEKGINVGTDWHFNWSSRDKGVKLEKKKKQRVRVYVVYITGRTVESATYIYIFIPVGNAFKLTAFASNISFQVKAVTLKLINLPTVCLLVRIRPFFNEDHLGGQRITHEMHLFSRRLLENGWIFLRTLKSSYKEVSSFSPINFKILYRSRF